MPSSRGSSQPQGFNPRLLCLQHWQMGSSLVLPRSFSVLGSEANNWQDVINDKKSYKSNCCRMEFLMSFCVPAADIIIYMKKRDYRRISRMLKPQIFFVFFFFWPQHPAWGSQFPNQGQIPGPLQWKNIVLTTGPPGKSLCFCFKTSCDFCLGGEMASPLLNINLLMGKFSSGLSLDGVLSGLC